MATSIFFTESKDFKLIKERILSQEDYYLVYVYADTTNIKIPKELIKELPVYGNNLIWIDTAHMDTSEISHHIVLTIGQLIDPEEEVNFYVVSKSVKFEKTVIFLRNQGIPAELIMGSGEQEPVIKAKATGRRGRPKKSQKTEKPAGSGKKRGRPKKEAAIAEAVIVPAEPKKRGRKKKEVTKADSPAVPSAPKKRGRPKKVASAASEIVPEKPAKEKPVKGKIKKEKKAPKKAAAKKVKKVKEIKKEPAVKGPKPSKPRKEKPITDEDVKAKLAAFEVDDEQVKHVENILFKINKVKRPKLLAKLVSLITKEAIVDDTEAERIVNRLSELGIIEVAPGSGKIKYKD